MNVKTMRRKSATSDATRRRHASMGDRIQAIVGQHLTAMETDAASSVKGTRKRAIPMAATGLLAMAGMFSMVASNALAVNFTAASSTHQIYTDKVTGAHAAGSLGVQDVHGDTDEAVVNLGFKTANLNGLCIIATQELPVLGEASVVLIAGEPVDGTITADPGKTIAAEQLYVSTNDLSGHGDQIQKLTLGQSADTLTMDDIGFAGAAGQFGLQAEVLNVSDFESDSYGIDLQGQINLPDLRIRVLPGAKSRDDCTAA